MSAQKFIDRIKKKDIVIGVIGLGYAGLPLAIEFAEEGFKVVGLDINQKRVAQLKKGDSYIEDIPSVRLKEQVQNKKFLPTDDPKLLSDVDAILICVQTPLRKSKEPDISFIIQAVEAIPAPGDKERLIVLQSTTFPGTTEEFIRPHFEKNGRKVGKNFYLAFAPERIDPSNKKYSSNLIPKIVGGETPECTQVAQVLFEQVIDQVVAVSSSRVAEMVKLLENTFRAVNIALVNEMALICNKMDMDVWEVIEAASTKPFGFMPFYPGPGLGGHCLPVDPLYLSWKAKIFDFDPRFIDLATVINAQMPQEVVNRVSELLNEKGKSLKGAHILALGVAYKKNVADYRESPALDVIDLLNKKGARIEYHDPCVAEFVLGEKEYKSKKLTSSLLKKQDMVVILTNHDEIDYQLLINESNLIFDTRNATKGLNAKKSKLVRL